MQKYINCLKNLILGESKFSFSLSLLLVVFLSELNIKLFPHRKNTTDIRFPELCVTFVANEITTNKITRYEKTAFSHACFNGMPCR